MNRLNKTIIIMIGIIVVLIAILSAVIIYMPTKNEELSDNKQIEIGEVILDECTDEYDEIQDEMVTTNSDNEKISPNCKIILNKYYKGCKDSINEYLQVPDVLVNCTKEELESYYKDWNIKEFSSNQIVLYKEFDGECGEHYILKNNDGKIIINKIKENGIEELYEKTEISTDYLPENDKESIKNGLKINGKEKLNELIESFE